MTEKPREIVLPEGVEKLIRNEHALHGAFLIHGCGICKEFRRAIAAALLRTEERIHRYYGEREKADQVAEQADALEEGR